MMVQRNFRARGKVFVTIALVSMAVCAADLSFGKPKAEIIDELLQQYSLSQVYDESTAPYSSDAGTVMWVLDGSICISGLPIDGGRYHMTLHFNSNDRLYGMTFKSARPGYIPAENVPLSIKESFEKAVSRCRANRRELQQVFQGAVEGSSVTELIASDKRYSIVAGLVPRDGADDASGMYVPVVVVCNKAIRDQQNDWLAANTRRR